MEAQSSTTSQEPGKIVKAYYIIKIFHTFRNYLIELINRHHNNLLAGYFDTQKIQKVIAWKYY